VARLRLFGPLRDLAGTGVADVPAGRVGEVLDLADARFGEAFARAARGCRIWVNGEPAGRESDLGEADELALVPPVSGG